MYELYFFYKKLQLAERNRCTSVHSVACCLVSVCGCPSGACESVFVSSSLYVGSRCEQRSARTTSAVSPATSSLHAIEEHCHLHSSSHIDATVMSCLLSKATTACVSSLFNNWTSESLRIRSKRNLQVSILAEKESGSHHFQKRRKWVRANMRFFHINVMSTYAKRLSQPPVLPFGTRVFCLLVFLFGVVTCAWRPDLMEVYCFPHARFFSFINTTDDLRVLVLSLLYTTCFTTGINTASLGGYEETNPTARHIHPPHLGSWALTT